MCGNKFSKNKDYIAEFLSCVANVLNKNENMLIFKEPSLYEKYFNNVKIDPVNFAFYKRIVDNSIPYAILSWDSYSELHDAYRKEHNLFLQGQITKDMMYDRWNKKLEMIFNE